MPRDPASASATATATASATRTPLIDALRQRARRPREASAEAATPGTGVGTSIAGLRIEEFGELVSVGCGVAHAAGLPEVRSEELVVIGRRTPALALDLGEHLVGLAVLEHHEEIAPGDEVRRTGRVLDVPVGPALLGRVIDGIGRPLDGRPAPATTERWPVEREAPPIMARAPVSVPLETGLKVIDALIPIGRGQRQLILGDRQTGKTTIAVDAILNQRDTGVACVYAAIGQPDASVARILDTLRRHEASEHLVVVVGAEHAPPGLRFITPYAAMTIAERFMADGRDVLLVLDDLGAHARAHRELSLLLRRPPGREAYPGDVFHIHSRLLERATHRREDAGGGSITALPIVETEDQDIAAFIPTNLISITDGQVVLSPTLVQRGILPAVDVGRSVSRVGGRTQHPAMRSVAGDLRLEYARFEELEAFSRFASRLDERTRSAIERGRRVREVLKQPRHDPIPLLEQLGLLLMAAEGGFDAVPQERVAELSARIRRRIRERLAPVAAELRAGGTLSPEQRQRLMEIGRELIDAAEADEPEAAAPAPAPAPAAEASP